MTANYFFVRHKWNILAAFVLVCVGSIIYIPSLDIGFWADDYSFFETAGRLSIFKYLNYYLDPQFAGQRYAVYRPMQGLQWGIEYALFQGDAFPYHVFQVLLHCANAFLLFKLASRLSRKCEVGLIAALLYITLSVDNLAVFWLGVVDPLAGVCGLATIWLWLNYLENGGSRRWFLAFCGFIVALLSKEIAITLPAVLFLVDRIIVGKPAKLRELLSRYFGFALTLLLYVFVEFRPLLESLAHHNLRFGDSSNIVAVLLRHLSTLAFPWTTNPEVNHAALAVVALYLLLTLFQHRWKFAALCAIGLLPVMLLLPFPASNSTAPRYLYMPLMATCIGYAEVSWSAIKAVKRLNYSAAIAPMLAILALCLVGGSTTSEQAVNLSGTARESRLEFRPIFDRHSALTPDTLFYFIMPPFDSDFVSGFFFRRYGANSVVSGTDHAKHAGLRDHRQAYVLYRDNEAQWQEAGVNRVAAPQFSSTLPIQFGDGIRLTDVELANSYAKPGDSIVMILYWSSDRKIDRDYTVFVHVVDAEGNIVAQSDHQPRGDSEPTSSWTPGNLIVDWSEVPIANDVPSGSYRLQVGLYYQPSMERLSQIDSTGAPDQFFISPIVIDGQQ